MTIRFKLNLSLLGAISITLAISTWIYLELRKVTTIVSDNLQVNALTKQVIQLNSLTYNYLNEPTSPASNQWHMVYTDLQRQLGEIRQSTGRLTEIPDHVIKNYDTIHESFQLIATANPQQYTTSAPASSLGSTLSSQLLRKNQELYDWVLNASNASNNRMLAVTRRDSVLFVALLLFIALGISSILWVLKRGLLQSITRLRSGVERIRQGNLDHRIVPLAADEFGELSASFNSMTAELQTAQTKLVAKNEELRYSESRYRAFFAQGPDGVVILEPETGRIVEFNDQACHQLGFTREEFGRLRVADIEAAESAEEVAERMRKVQKEGHNRFETRQRTKQGEIRDVHVIAQIIQAGQVPIYHCIWRDITERKDAERQLREREERHRSLFMAMQEGFALHEIICDAAGRPCDYRYLEVNPAFERTTGIAREQWIGRTVREVLPNVEDYWIEGYGAVALTGQPATLHHYVKELDQHYEVAAYSPKHGQFAAIALNVTDRKRAEQALRESEERFRGILQNVATVAVQGYAVDGTVRYWNRASETFYNYTAAEALGRNLLDLIIPPAMRGEVSAAIQRMVETGEPPPSAELTLQRKDGSLISVYSSHALVKVPGREAELFCIDVDLSAHQQAEAEKDKLQEQLTQAQKMESVGRLAGGVAHDFNNMLQAILGNTSLALMDLDPDSPLRESLEEIQKAAQRSADLTRQLLAFARKQTIAPKVLDLNETVAGMLKMLRRLIGEDIDLAWLPGADLGLVHMDPSQVDQILANLCVNARDAIGAGVGKVTIETENMYFDKTYVADHPEARIGEYVRLAVSDNGCGMSPEVQAHLFEPFFTTKGLGQGTGLGLATVYGIVKQNQGFIRTYSEPSQGTTFQIHLPRHTEQAVHPTVEASTPSPSGGNETILLVEDEPSILRVSQRLLTSLGYQVLAARTPGEAIKLAREHVGEIHLLLTDVVMPEMNGRDLARNLLSHYPNLKLLFMSGYTANVIAHHGVLDPGVHFIQKPCSIQALADKLREVLDA